MTYQARGLASDERDLVQQLNKRERHLAGYTERQVFRPTKAVTAALTVEPNQNEVICADASSGAFTVTLPRADKAKGVSFDVFKTDSGSNAVTVDGNGSETINGSTTQTVDKQYDSLRVTSDGSNWVAKEALAGSGRFTVKNLTNSDSPYTALSTEHLYTCDTSSGNITINLPAVSGLNGHQYMFIKTSSASTLVVDPNAAETINTSAIQSRTSVHSSFTIIGDGTTWWIIA